MRRLAWTFAARIGDKYQIRLTRSIYISVKYGWPAVRLMSASWQNQQCGCTPSEDSDQPGHPTSLIRVFAVRMKKAWVLSYPLSAQRRLWSDWADAQADPSFCWAHSHIVCFVMRRLIFPQFLFFSCIFPNYILSPKQMYSTDSI